MADGLSGETSRCTGATGMNRDGGDMAVETLEALGAKSLVTYSWSACTWLRDMIRCSELRSSRRIVNHAALRPAVDMRTTPRGRRADLGLDPTNRPVGIRLGDPTIALRRRQHDNETRRKCTLGRTLHPGAQRRVEAPFAFTRAVLFSRSV